MMALMLAAVGCSSSGRDHAAGADVIRDPVKAEALYREGIELLKDPKPSDGDLKDAEGKFRAALESDAFHGPAHNNLGTLLLNQGKLSDAAEEFEKARKLLPGNPEPRINLAIALDRGGKRADALEAAKSALESAPGNLPAIQAVAYIQVRENLRDDQTEKLLGDIAMRSSDPTWADWARRSQHGPHIERK